MRSSESEVGVYAAPSRHVDSRWSSNATISVHVHSCTPEGKRRAALSLSLRPALFNPIRLCSRSLRSPFHSTVLFPPPSYICPSSFDSRRPGSRTRATRLTLSAATSVYVLHSKALTSETSARRRTDLSDIFFSTRERRQNFNRDSKQRERDELLSSRRFEGCRFVKIVPL